MGNVTPLKNWPTMCPNSRFWHTTPEHLYIQMFAHVLPALHCNCVEIIVILTAMEEILAIEIVCS